MPFFLAPLVAAGAAGTGLGANWLSGGKNPGAYATGNFDLASGAARKTIEDYEKGLKAGERTAYDEAVKRGTEARERAKLLELQQQAGPHLAATEVKAMPYFLRQGEGPMLYSGADRGTGYGAALEEAIQRGERTTPEQQITLGAKGTPTGIANEQAPRFRPLYTGTSLLPADILHGQAGAQAQQMSQGK
jgi:hypothetical protein